MENQRVIFRADGNLEIGYGHFIRSLGIAGLIKDEFHCTYATQKPTEYQLNEISSVCQQTIELSNDNRHYAEFLDCLKEGDIVVLDNYFFSSEYQLQIRAQGCKVIFIDDHNDKNYVCDVLLNNIPGFDKSSFKKSEYTKLYLGTDYALLRKAFFNKELRAIEKVKKSFFLAFGGADIYNFSKQITGFINEIDSTSHINLLIGDAYKFHNDLRKIDNLTIHNNISADKVANLIARSEICIVPASSLLNETASIGSKILLGYFADNQLQPYNYFIENNLAIGVGDYRNLSIELFRSQLEKLQQSDFLIDNQRKIYFFQQADNIKKIFYDLQSN